MDGLFLDERAKFGTQCFFGHQIDRFSQQIFKKKLDAKVAL